MKKIALLFPGQGSQYIGMGKNLCERFTVANETFEEANEVLGFDLKKMCFEGSMDELTKTENTQPALLTASVAAFRVYMQEIGLEPSFCAGHSLGEFSALTCSEVIKFHDALKIVRQRGKFMQEAVAIGGGAMAAISGIDKLQIEAECKNSSADGNIVVVSNYNSPEQIVISGHQAAVNQVGEMLKTVGARVTPLKVSAPFHSPLMQVAADKLRRELELYKYNNFKYPVISNVTALPYISKNDVINNLSLQIVQPVKWQSSMEYIRGQEAEMAIELGPQTVLRNLMKKNAPQIPAYSYDKEEDEKVIKEKLKNNSSTSRINITVVTKCLAAAVCTKNRNWDTEEYQKGVIEPYGKIQEMQDKLEEERRKPTVEEMGIALKMLELIFKTKRVPESEQVERFSQIFEQTGTRELFSNFKITAA